MVVFDKDYLLNKVMIFNGPNDFINEMILLGIEINHPENIPRNDRVFITKHLTLIYFLTDDFFLTQFGVILNQITLLNSYYLTV